MWISTSVGMSVFDGVKFTNYPSTSSLFIQACFRPVFDKNNNAWIASAGGGLYKFDGTNFKQIFSSKNGLTSDYVRDVLIDKNDLWIIADGGVSVIKNAILSNKEVENENHAFKIFPNPTKESISFSPNVEDNTKYQLFDVNGRIIQKGIILNSTVNVENLPKGFYLLSFSNDGSSHTVKLVKIN